MSKPTRGHAPSPTGRGRSPAARPLDAAAEARVRALIAAGDREALEHAKDLHRTHRTADSEALLVDAYVVRIEGLLGRNLTVEAHALIDLVRQRHPSARARLRALGGPAGPPAATLDDLVRPLADAGLPAARRAGIERTIGREVWDLGALARCEALPAGHPLRAAASALDQAFVAVTSGPVEDAALALPEVSHRSPLAPWKRVVRAIAGFHRGDDAACRQHLEGLDPASVPARVTPVLHAMIDGDAADRQTGPAATLRSRITGNPAALRSALQTLDAAFASASESRIVKAARAAIQECGRGAPDRLAALRQRIWAQSRVLALDMGKIVGALGGQAPQEDAVLFRLTARSMEETGDPGNLVIACAMWDQFRQQAPREGWFAPNGPEVAMVYLHMAELIQRLPADMLQEVQQSVPMSRRRSLWGPHGEPGGEDLWFVFPDRLFQRACALDLDSDAFPRWMAWARRAAPYQTTGIAEAWHKARPLALPPILHLMNDAAERRAFGTALRFLARAERIDRVHEDVRAARMPLVTASILRHLAQKKIAAADDSLAELAALPQVQQGRRPAVIAALRLLIAEACGRNDETAAARAEVERVLGSAPAVELLLSAMASSSKRRAVERLGPVATLPAAARAALPIAVTTVAALAAELRLTLNVPPAWMQETARQFRRCQASLDADQLRLLGEAALSAGHAELAFAVSAVGLGRGGADCARFLLLRARALPHKADDRRLVCAAAAAALAREERDTALAGDAVDMVGDANLVFTRDQAVGVLEKERAHAHWPSGRRTEPDYEDLLAPVLCQCPNCRRKRGEPPGDFDDLDPFDDAEDLGLDLPPGLPPAIAAILIEEMRDAMRRGETPEEFMARVMSEAGPGRRSKRRKSRRR